MNSATENQWGLGRWIQCCIWVSNPLVVEDSRPTLYCLLTNPFSKKRERKYRRKIRLIEVNAKCRHLKKLTCKGTLRQVFIWVNRLEIANFLRTFSHLVFSTHAALWSVRSPVSPLTVSLFQLSPLSCANKYAAWHSSGAAWHRYGAAWHSCYGAAWHSWMMRRGTVGSASACWKAGPSSTVGSAPQGGLSHWAYKRWSDGERPRRMYCMNVIVWLYVC